MKYCSVCNIEKFLDDFHKQKSAKDGYKCVCKECRKVKSKEYYVQNTETIKKKVMGYRKENYDKIIEYRKIYSELNKDKKKEYDRIYREQNKEKIKEYQKKYREYNKDKLREYKMNRYYSDTFFKLKHNIGTLIRESFKRKGEYKNSSTTKILGCTYEELKKHLEDKFDDWMSWENRGLYNGNEKYGWDIDHIIPLSTAKTNEDLIRLNHYTNLQPLCSKINREVKRDNY